jgi:hypothetical protein
MVITLSKIEGINIEKAIHGLVEYPRNKKEGMI